MGASKKKTKIRDTPKHYRGTTVFLAVIALCELLELVLLWRGR